MPFLLLEFTHGFNREVAEFTGRPVIEVTKVAQACLYDCDAVAHILLFDCGIFCGCAQDGNHEQQAKSMILTIRFISLILQKNRKNANRFSISKVSSIIITWEK